MISMIASRALKLLILSSTITLLMNCGGKSAPSDTQSGTPSNSILNCDGSCITTQKLTADDVKQVLAQAIAEAKAQNSQATIAVSDRVGNILAVYRMGDAAQRVVTIVTEQDGTGNAVISGGLEGIKLPRAGLPFNIDGQAAIAKAITGAYLSTEGNAFSTRTANQIVQEHFNPGELFQPAGPLFGVQFSQLACSDFIQKYNGGSADFGPKRSPLGLSADPGGFPLYKDGTVVGGVGVMSDGIYGIDTLITDNDRNLDELIALAATYNFSAPTNRRADRITVDGKTFRFSDVEFSSISSTSVNITAFDALTPADGSLIAVTGYNTASINEGTIFTTAASGVRAATGSFSALDAFVFVDDLNNERFPPTAGTDGLDALSAIEVETLLAEAIKIANRSRAQIRQPLNTPARVTVSIVDSNGNNLGILRTRDAPIFGSDVSLQKARTAAFFSSTDAASTLALAPHTNYLAISDTGITSAASIDITSYTTALREFVDNPTALADGAFAFSDRAGGNLSRPYFPDGIDTNDHGPLSKAQGFWSPFSTGLQLDLVFNGILQHVLSTATGNPAIDVDNTLGCGGIQLDVTAPTTFNFNIPPVGMAKHLANGIQIFPGSVPIYRGSVLVGGIGVSGDGVDQDDMIAFLGLHNAGVSLSGSINLPPIVMRADQLSPQGTRLRFIQCPQAPFIDSDEQTPCEGK